MEVARLTKMPDVKPRSPIAGSHRIGFLVERYQFAVPPLPQRGGSHLSGMLPARAGSILRGGVGHQHRVLAQPQ